MYKPPKTPNRLTIETIVTIENGSNCTKFQRFNTTFKELTGNMLFSANILINPRHQTANGKYFAIKQKKHLFNFQHE